jgi:hypothetical protein
MVVLGGRSASRFARTVLIAAGLVLITPAIAADSALSGLTGSWGGGGVIKYSDGSTERMRCNARYSGNADMSMSINCSSSERSVNISASLHAKGGRVSGNWSESNLGVSGSASGNASPGKLSLGLGGGVSGTMSVNYSGSSQSVGINVSGAPLTSVTMNLSKR